MEVGWVVLLELDNIGLQSWIQFVSLEDSQQLGRLLLIFVVDDHGLIFLLLVSLDLDSCLGLERNQRHLLDQLSHLLDIRLHGQLEKSSIDVCCRLHELEVDRIVDIELKGSGDSLQTAPEEFASVFDDMIGREGIEQLFDLIVENILKDVHTQLHTSLVALGLVGQVQLVQSLQLDPQSSRVLSVLFLKLFKETGPVVEVAHEISRGVCEGAFEVVPSPLDGVFDLVREVLEGAEGNAFLRRVNDIRIADSGMRDNDLGVALGAQSA